ncbi:MAG: hypothetical protein JWM68_1198 [Verrucomicrobiales bacterium]|nr:hypothetical protein [Verrucomicrobiales bacterium]
MNCSHLSERRRSTVRDSLVAVLLFIMAAFAASDAKAAGLVDATNRFVWSESSGWINFAPETQSVSVAYNDTNRFLTGYVWGENVGYIRLSSSTNGPFLNTTATNWGINLNTTGVLSGFAWGENIGWINFGGSNSVVQIDAATGFLQGYAWGENIGWIRFRSATNAAVLYGMQVDSSRPEVVITSPESDERLTNGFSITMTGTASDVGGGLARVKYRLNGGSLSDAAGTTNWTAPLTLLPGTNLVEVKSVDLGGNESDVLSRTFFCATFANLTLIINGSGTIVSTPTPYGTPTNGARLETGRSYTVTAIPGVSSLFSNWSGTTTYPAAEYVFIMQSNLVLTANFVTNNTSQTAMTSVRFYHLGEGDAGVGHTVVATNSLDSVSTNALLLTGAPKYWNHAAPGNINSTFSLLFSTTNQGTAAIVSDTNNVCLEAWANTGWRSTHVVAYNGNPTLNGYGLVLETNTYKAVLGGVGTVGAVPCPPGQWMHLALVCSNGTANFFTNGVLAAVINATPLPPTGNLTIGGPNTGTNDVQGFVDEVRISTFAPGGFSAGDLLYTPRLGSMTITHLAPDKVVISVPTIYSSVTLQASTNLTMTNWQSLAAPAVLGNQQVWTNSLQGTARFYRLTKAIGDKPVPVIIMEQEGNPFPLTFNGSFVIEPLDGIPSYTEADTSSTVPVIYDASASLDPFSGSSNTLSFHWEIWKSEYYGGTTYTSYGVTGYHAPVLQIGPNSMPDLTDHGTDSDMAFWRVRLTMQHIPFTPDVVPAQETVLWFRFHYLASELGLAMANICQSCPPPPASCSGCTIQAGRATAETP